MNQKVIFLVIFHFLNISLFVIFPRTGHGNSESLCYAFVGAVSVNFIAFLLNWLSVNLLIFVKSIIVYRTVLLIALIITNAIAVTISLGFPILTFISGEAFSELKEFQAIIFESSVTIVLSFLLLKIFLGLPPYPKV
jgi:hypothetical protein